MLMNYEQLRCKPNAELQVEHGIVFGVIGLVSFRAGDIILNGWLCIDVEALEELDLNAS